MPNLSIGLHNHSRRVGQHREYSLIHEKRTIWSSARDLEVRRTPERWRR